MEEALDLSFDITDDDDDNILVHCEGVGLQGYWYQVYDRVYNAKGCGMLLARVTTIVLLCLPGNSTFYAPFGIHESDSCYA